MTMPIIERSIIHPPSGVPRARVADRFDVAIVGGGIVGLASARAMLERWPGIRVAVVEKELSLGLHQTGRNSGVLHSGIYYKPGSFKSRLCASGNVAMVAFCEEHGIAYERCGKLIVASDESERVRLHALRDRGVAAGIEVSLLTRTEIAEREPNVVGVEGLWVPATGITDYTAVLHALAGIVERHDGLIALGTEVLGFRHITGEHILQTTKGEIRARWLVNCAGLQSDRVAARSGAEMSARIVPFRGEYFELAAHRRSLVKGLVYPVPDPDFPFLGVHFTRMVDGSVHAGPNAVLALAREGYRKTDVSLRDIVDVVSFPGFWRLARRHAASGVAEMARSASKRLFLRSLRKLIPELELDDLVPTHAGVRAQLLERSGALVDDFMIVQTRNATHVCNAPSPAATSSLEIGRLIADQVAPLRA